MNRHQGRRASSDGFDASRLGGTVTEAPRDRIGRPLALVLLLVLLIVLVVDFGLPVVARPRLA